jgi:beta-barrel assembly-enhancing protease
MRLHAILVIVLTAAALVVAVPGCIRPVPSGRVFALEADEEAAVGRAGAKQVLVQFGGALDTAAVQAYVRTIGERVARTTGQTRWPYRFTVLADRQARIFSLPGGQIFVTQGLLEKLESEAQLAGLLARQMAFIERHYDETQVHLASQVMEEAASAAAAELSNRQPGRREAESLAKVVAAWSDVRYPSTMLTDAERLGLDYMVAAGYHSSEMVRLVGLLAGLEGPPAAVAEHTEAVRQAAERKYPDRGGRIGRQEYRGEILDRLKAG